MNAVDWTIHGFLKEVGQMLKPKTRWVMKEVNEGLREQFTKELQLSPLLTRLLLIRGIDSIEKATAFLYGKETDFYDPFLLSDMDKAIQRTREAIEYGEPILIYGDYDADGVTSTSILIHILRKAGAVFQYYIPNRFTEGYGLNDDALRKAAEKGFSVVITVDTGISAVKEAELAKELGLDLIITDHHEPPQEIPDAFAVINPKKPGCTYPFPMLAGAGVAFKFGHALLGSFPHFVLDIAGVGTIADLVPLVDENRLLAKYGLQAIDQSTNPGIQALKKVCGIKGSATAYHVGFGMGPRINATGRLESADRAVKLLTTNDEEEAQRYANELDLLNKERQLLVDTITREAMESVELLPVEQRKVLVVAGEEWNEGVIGIVASRLVEKYYRPTIVLSINKKKGIAKGSARSIEGYNMYEALTLCKELLPHYGGHPMAAGMTLSIDDLSELRSRLNEIAEEWLIEEDYQPITKVDALCSLSEMNLTTISEIEKLAPFGIGNPAPRILINNVEITELRAIGKNEDHLKCQFFAENDQLDGIGFKMGPLLSELPSSANVNVLGELTANEWNQKRKPQFVIKDLSIPEIRIFDWRGSKNKSGKIQSISGNEIVDVVIFRQEKRKAVYELNLGTHIRIPEEISDVGNEVNRIILYDLPRSYSELEGTLQKYSQLKQVYCLFDEEKSLLPTLPGRGHFAEIYKTLIQHKCLTKEDLPLLAKAKGIPLPSISFVLAVFQELGFVSKKNEGYILEAANRKRDLTDSSIYCCERDRLQLETELLYSSAKDLTYMINQYCSNSDSIKEVVTHEL